MKKARLVLLSLFLLSACSSPTVQEVSQNSSTETELTVSANINSDSGIYDYIYGDNSTVTSISARTPQGNIYNGILHDGIFQIAVPSLGVDQNVKLLFSDGKKENTSEINVPSKKIIDNYPNFAKQINSFIPEINELTKTRFPENVENGIKDIAMENGVTTTINVYDGNLIGLELKTEGDANKEMATIFVAFQMAYDALNDGISDAYNNTIDTKEKNTFISKGFNFTFEYSDSTLFASIIKI